VGYAKVYIAMINPIWFLKMTIKDGTFENLKGEGSCG